MRLKRILALATGFVLLSQNQFAYAEKSETNSCGKELLKEHDSLFPGLSPYWAQDLIGAEFAKDLLHSQNTKFGPFRTVKVANLDGGFNPKQVNVFLSDFAAAQTTKLGDNVEHGNKVLNLISGRGRYGAGAADYVHISDTPTYLTSAAEANATDPFPQDAAESAAEAKLNTVITRELKRLAPEIAELKIIDTRLTKEGWPKSLLHSRANLQNQISDTILSTMSVKEEVAFKFLMTANKALVFRDIGLNLEHEDESGSKEEAGEVPKLAGTVLRTNPDLLNYEADLTSQMRGSVNESLNYFFTVVSKKTVIVAAAGNAFRSQKYSDARLIHGSSVIVVGNLLPSGLTDASSSYSGDVMIMAPAGSEQLSHLQYLDVSSPHESDESFGGTSGATPLVTGALGNAMAILGTVSSAQAKKLLVATAVPLPYSGEGVGMLNGYKLAAYALRLKSRGWPTNAELLLGDKSLLDFVATAKTLLRRASQLKLKEINDCDAEIERLNLLRKSFLLAPSSKTASLIAQLYRQLGYPRNARFYEIFAGTKEERLVIAAEMQTTPSEVNKQVEVKDDLRIRNPRFFNSEK